MKKLQLLLLTILIPFTILSQEAKIPTNQNFFYGIDMGLNFSQFKYDDIDFNFGLKPAIGLYGKYKISKHLYLKNALLYSRKGSISSSLKIDNSYLDINIIPQFKLFGDFYVQTGFSYSYLLKAQEQVINGTKTFGIERIEINGFDSESSIITGIELKLQKNVNIEFNYFIPLSTAKTTNFQLGLTLLLNNKSPKKVNYRQLARRQSQEQIQQLKQGILLVRLKTSENKIYALEKVGQIEKAEKVKREQDLENKKIISAFKKNFNFCNVAFFYSNHSNNIRDKKINNIFLDDSLAIDYSIKIDTNKVIFIAEFSTIEQDTAKYFSHHSYERNGNLGLKRVNHYYGQPNFRFQALLIKNDAFIQLNDPFPYYARAIFKSMKKHPEQALFLSPILPFQNWTYDATVKTMNIKLENYFKAVKRKK